jgi:hypothetical protein
LTGIVVKGPAPAMLICLHSFGFANSLLKSLVCEVLLALLICSSPLVSLFDSSGNSRVQCRGLSLGLTSTVLAS